MWELKYKHHLSLPEYYDMMPYERQIYLDLSEEHIKENESNN
jgi:hypothetical protein